MAPKWSKLSQGELRELLHCLGAKTDGVKAALVARLAQHLTNAKADHAGNALSVAVARAAAVARDVRAGGPTAAQVAELRSLGASVETRAWQDAHSELAAAVTNAVVSLSQHVPKVAAAAATAYTAAHTARVQHNQNTCELFHLLERDDIRDCFLRPTVWGIAGLWRLRRVSRALRSWATLQLESLPQVVAVGGLNWVTDATVAATKYVAALDLSTMRWSSGCVPALPDPRAQHAVSSVADGRIIVCPGINEGGGDELRNKLDNTTLQWIPGSQKWTILPALLPTLRQGSASVTLRDGRTMLIGGWENGRTLSTVSVLAADGSAWSELTPMVASRMEPAAAVLPDGAVLVAGGKSYTSRDLTALKTSELWDPTTQVWTAVPDMATERTAAAAAVLPNGWVAVIGGISNSEDFFGEKEWLDDAEAFDPARRVWEPLHATMNATRANHSVVAVAGSLVCVGGCDGREGSELYDVQTKRWIELSNNSSTVSQASTRAVLVPKAALVAA